MPCHTAEKLISRPKKRRKEGNRMPDIEKAPQKKSTIMSMKVDESIAAEFRKLAKESGLEQGYFLQAMIDNFRLNEDKSLYKEHAEDIQLVRDLTATITYKYIALLSENKVAAEKANAKTAKKIAELEAANNDLLSEKEVWDYTRKRNVQMEHEINELKEMLHKLENKIEQMTASHKNEIDALTNKHNAEMTEMAQSYAEKYMQFVKTHAENKS